MTRWLRGAFIALALLSMTAPLEGAVTRSNTYSTADASGTTITVSSVNIASGEYALMTCMWRKNASQTMDSITFNGSGTGTAAVTSSNVDTSDGEGSQRTFSITGVTGTASAVATFSASVNGHCIVRTFAGVDTGGTPLGTTQSASGGASTVTVNSSSASSGDLVVDSVVYRGGASLTVGAGQSGVTQLGTAGSSVSAHVSEESGTGAITMSWTGADGVSKWSTVAILIKASAGGGGSTCSTRMALTGAGC